MSMSNLVVFPSDFVISPANGLWSGTKTASFTVPGYGRTYSSACNSSTLTPVAMSGEDALLLQGVGWLGLDSGPTPCLGAGSWAGRPTGLQPYQVGSMFVDTTNNRVVFYAGPTSGWVNAVSGAVYGP